jgi:hypothetical protein
MDDTEAEGQKNHRNSQAGPSHSVFHLLVSLHQADTQHPASLMSHQPRTAFRCASLLTLYGSLPAPRRKVPNRRTSVNAKCGRQGTARSLENQLVNRILALDLWPGF